MPRKKNNKPDKERSLEPSPDTIEPDEFYTPEDVEKTDENINTTPTDVPKGVPADHTITGKAPKAGANRPKKHLPEDMKKESDV